MPNEIMISFMEDNWNLEKQFITGFRDLDNYIKKVKTGSLITIGGRPAMGKTEFALSIFNNLLADNKKVMYLNLDLSKEYFINRLVANKTNLPIKYILDRSIKNKENTDWEYIATDLFFYDDKKFKVLNEYNMTIEEFERKINNNRDIDIVIVDYIQLLKNTNEDFDIIHELKRMAIEKDIIIIVLSQISRRVEHRNDHRPMLADLKTFSSLEELSDVVLMLYRESYYNLDEDVSPNLELIIRKNNFGAVGSLKLDYKNDHFTDIEPLF